MALDGRIARFTLAVLAWAPLLAFSACVDRKAVGEDGEKEDAGPIEDAGPGWSDGALPPLTSTCPSQRGMVGIPFPDGACYLMDSWPVTRGEYLAALAAGPLVSSDPNCVDRSPGEGPRWVERRYPGQVGLYCFLDHEIVESTGEVRQIDNRMPWPPSEIEAIEPMVCVSWCDAHAYCERVGKRLCGNRGLDPSGDYDSAVVENAMLDEMYNACSGGGKRRSPTGERRLSLGDNQAGIHLYLPLSNQQLVEGGEGAFQGAFGLRVAGEHFGPLYLSTLLDYAEVGETVVYRGCAAMAEPIRESSLVSPVEHHFSGTTTFRCCADAAP